MHPSLPNPAQSPHRTNGIERGNPDIQVRKFLVIIKLYGVLPCHRWVRDASLGRRFPRKGPCSQLRTEKEDSMGRGESTVDSTILV